VHENEGTAENRTVVTMCNFFELSFIIPRPLIVGIVMRTGVRGNKRFRAIFDVHANRRKASKAREKLWKKKKK
jgi:hypothetical protein